MPDTLRLTGELKPISDNTLIVELADFPCWTVRLVGDVDMAKSGPVVVAIAVVE